MKGSKYNIMIKLRFEPNDMTDKYDAKLDHTEIHVETHEGEKITEEQVLKIMPFIHALANDTIDLLTVKIIYNKTGCNDELCPKDIREKIVELFGRDKTILTTNFFNSDTEKAFYHFIFNIKFMELEDEYLKLLDIKAHSDRALDLNAQLYAYPYDCSTGEMQYYTNLRYKTDYKLGKDDRYYEELNTHKKLIKFKA